MSAPKDICPVCLDDLEVRGGRTIINPGCGHSLHLECYTDFIKRYNTCSVCKKPLGKGPENSQIAPPAPPTLPVSTTLFSPMIYQPMQQPMQQSMQQPMPRMQSQQYWYPPIPQPPRASFRPEDDDPVFQADPDPFRADPVRSASTPTSDSPPTYISLTLQSEHTSLTRDTESLVTCLASLEAPACPISQGNVHTQATDLVMVLDISGSMAGSKLNLLKETLRYVLTQLQPRDRVSLITFSSSARKETPLWLLSEERRIQFERAITKINTEGGTNIGSGLSMGLDLLAQRLTKNPSAAMFLLSDGQDNEGTGWKQYVSQAKNASIPIHTFGYGNDADSKTLSLIAEASNGGTFNHIAKLDDVQHCFAGTLGGLLALGYQNPSVMLQANEGYSIIQKVLGSYPVELDAHGMNAKVRLGDLYYGEKRDLLIEVLVKKTDSHANQDKGKGKETESRSEILAANCAYEDITRKIAISQLPTPASLSISRHVGPNCSNTFLNPAIEKQRMRLATAASISSAVQHAEAGRFNDAQRVLSLTIEQARDSLGRLRMESISDDGAAGAIFTDEDEAFHDALIEDLGENMSRLKNRSSSDEGGIASARYSNQTHQTQRANFGSTAALHYQTAMSQQFEKKSRASKLQPVVSPPQQP